MRVPSSVLSVGPPQVSFVLFGVTRSYRRRYASCENKKNKIKCTFAYRHRLLLYSDHYDDRTDRFFRGFSKPITSRSLWKYRYNCTKITVEKSTVEETHKQRMTIVFVFLISLHIMTVVYFGSRTFCTNSYLPLSTVRKCH